ncbi:MAG: type II toxin-antitoxin system VapC family toxin [Bifidobacteriaceae bacterium]|jgi:tRNA(fMet)-specific endonuclease VapC|nr:type II toxin-antitoxin system VapC family toxin [Bifidobacteriaceae bacterium]
MSGPTYFLDTDICVNYLRARSPSLRDRVLAARRGQIAVPAMVQAELEFGAHRSARQRENLAHVARFLAMLTVVPFDAAAARHHGAIRAELARAGLPIGPNELVIAATVMAAGGVLVTHNTAEFQRVPGLSIQDWT